jgi:C-terminal processing protease CtpA/Prc
MMSESEESRIERLVSLGKLWGAVKYFHPYLAYREDIDWDAALVSAIPQVNAANSAGEYAAAVQSMLLALGDPATRVIEQEDNGTASSERERQPTYTVTPDDILVVTIHHYEDLTDFPSAVAKMAAVKKEIPQARGVLFDLRAKTALSQEKFYLSFAFAWSRIATMLSATPFAAAGERSRMHSGFAPQTGLTSGSYTSAFNVVDGRRILPAPEAKDVPTVFLINAWSELPPEALALQTAGKAIIMAEGGASDACLVKTHRIPLTDDLIAQMRLGELIFADGTGGFLPDIVVPASQNSEEEDQALTAALELFRDFRPKERTRAPLPARAVPAPENAYPEMTYPSPEYRLLAAFRIWTVINYFFPYKHLMEEEWDSVLREFIPRMEQADSAVAYHLAVAEMITHIDDSHGLMQSPVLKEHFGPAWPPIRLQMVKDSAVITAILDEEAAKTAGVAYGDIVLQIDGQDISERIAQHARYLAASTPQCLMLRAANASLTGPEHSVAVLTIRDRDNNVKEVKLTRGGGVAFLSRISWRSGEVIKLLSQDIGYADLDRLEVPMVDEMFEQFKNTKAIIFDGRGYPKGTAWAIAPRLAAENGVKAALIQRPVVMMPDGASGEIASQSITYSFVQSIPLTEKWRYGGKTVMLIDERALSQAEHTGLFFEAANNTKFVGSHTAGANGDVTHFVVPGGVYISFTGASVSHADGRQLQRIGLVPHIEVKPTIKGIQAGRDEVLEAAVAYVQRELDGNLTEEFPMGGAHHDK